MVLSISIALTATLVQSLPYLNPAIFDSSQQSSSPPPRIYGGVKTKTCEFPTSVTFSATSCTGTLVHPKVVLTAGHCNIRSGNVLFGETKSSASRSVRIKWCEGEPLNSSDYAICVLSEAVTDVPIAPILQGCEAEELKVGGTVTLAGFGAANNASPGDPTYGIKRWVDVPIKSISSKQINIGGGGKGGCNGDSGGPAFLKLSDGTWRTIGATHAGKNMESHPNCDEGVWKLTHVALPWYEKKLKDHGEADIDLSPCFDDSGNWAPNSDCGGYAKDIKGPFGTWTNGCSDGAPLSGPSSTCGPALDEEAPTVEILSPSDGDKFPEGESVEIKVEAMDNIGVKSVELFVNMDSVGSVDASPYVWSLDDLEPGSQEVHAIAIDESGNETTSSAIKFTVVPPDDDTSSSEESDTGDDDDDDDNDDDTSDDDDDDDDANDDDDDDDDDDDNDDDDTSDDDDDDDTSSDDDNGGDDDSNNPSNSSKQQSDNHGGGCATTSTGSTSWTTWSILWILFGLQRHQKRRLD